jgi:monoamine oxidase
MGRRINQGVNVANISDDGYFIVEELRQLREVTSNIDTRDHERISQIFQRMGNLETIASNVERLLGSIRTILFLILLATVAVAFK